MAKAFPVPDLIGWPIGVSESCLVSDSPIRTPVKTGRICASSETTPADGRREVLGFEVGEAESQPLWTEFLLWLMARGRGRVKLVLSGAHPSLIAAIETVFAGSAWQRCRVHFVRNVLSNVPKASGPMVVASIIRTIFVQPDTEHVFAQFHEVVQMLTRSHLKIADMRR